MASILIMMGGAILNATAFIGGSYIVKALTTDDDTDETADEKKRHDLALEKYNDDLEAQQKKNAAFDEWKYEREKTGIDAASDFQTTDEALQQYNLTHQETGFAGEQPTFTDLPPKFSDYYKPSGAQKKGELLYVGGGMLVIGYLASIWL